MHDEPDELDDAPLADESALDDVADVAADPAAADIAADEQDAVAYDDGADISDDAAPVRPEGGRVPDYPLGVDPAVAQRMHDEHVGEIAPDVGEKP